MPENGTVRMRFNKGVVAGIDPPEQGRAWAYDTVVPGLALMVTPRGARSFYLYRRVNGRPSKVRIGRWPDWTVEQARTAAAKLNGEIADGKDPAEARRVQRGAGTLEEAWTEFLDAPSRRKRPKAPSTVKGYQDLWDWFLAPWSGRRLASIRPGDVDALHSRIAEKNGQYAANRAVALLSAIYEHAARKGLAVPNPAKGVERFAEPSRERFIRRDEMPRFLGALNAEADDRAREFFRFLLLTGARRSEAQGARWADVDLKRPAWRIPNGKGGKARDVPLVKQAVALLKARREAVGPDAEFVFPAHGRAGHLVESRKPWERVVTAAEMDDLRLHDLRRTLATWMIETGATSTVVGAVLGHAAAGVTGVYARVSEDAAREAMQAAADAMEAAGREQKARKGRKGAKR